MNSNSNKNSFFQKPIYNLTIVTMSESMKNSAI